jgi:bifunctional UDP-N-acetylglucosamine pyrophosphorylase/glucosamine-1-phosphate N-acetyltransferase
MHITPIILAAGPGTRMKSDLPKALHPFLGQPLVWHAANTLKQVTDVKPIVVVGQAAEMMHQILADSVHIVSQGKYLGTGHAVLQLAEMLKGQTDYLLVSYADMPLLTADTFNLVIETQLQDDSPLTILSTITDDPRGFGRVIRDSEGNLLGVVDEDNCTAEQLKICEINASVYCIQADWLWSALARVPRSLNGEYDLTDLVGVARSQNLSVQTAKITDPLQAIDINTRFDLAKATAHMRERVNRHWMLDGVTIMDPQTTYIEVGVTLGRDSVIWPNTYLLGDTHIGEACTVGPNTHIRDTRVGKRCEIFASVLEGAVLENDVDIGPFARLRKGAHLANGVHMGNFGEVKNSYLGPGTKMGHFSYLGDATLAGDVNIGAGTITCNYDGKNKYATEIGQNAFIGSDTMLVAPVKIGQGARTGAGSVVTKDVPANTLAVGMPARKIKTLKD